MKLETLAKVREGVMSNPNLKAKFEALNPQQQNEVLRRLYSRLVNKHRSIRFDRMFAKSRLKKELSYKFKTKLPRYGGFLVVMFAFFMMSFLASVSDEENNRSLLAIIWGDLKTALWFTLICTIFMFGYFGMSIIQTLRTYWDGYEIDDSEQIKKPREVLAVMILFNLFAVLLVLAFSLNPYREVAYLDFLKACALSSFPVYITIMATFLVWLLIATLKRKNN